MSSIKLIDTTLRDGVQSLWALNMRPEHLPAIVGDINRAGFDQIEVMAPGAAFKKFVRHLGENPWDHIRAMLKGLDTERLRWHGRFEGYALSGGIPPEVGALLIRRVVDLGIRYTRIGNNWNDFGESLADKKRRLEAMGMQPIINVMYSVSARHTDEYFVRKAREAAALKPYRLCFKDVGGLLTPDRARILMPAMIAETGDVPWEFHGHCNNGFGPMNAIAAAESGIRYVHTGIPPLANGNAQPAVGTVTGNLRDRGFDVDVDLEPLASVTRHLEAITVAEGFPRGVQYEFNERQSQHQVPGGMISNLAFQLEQAGIGNRLEETLEESVRVRRDFGYPIMVTPLSQFVGSQAAINVIVGERYRQVSDDVIHYAWGRHGGQEAIEAMDPEVRALILDRPRGRELENYEEPAPTLTDLRSRFGATISDEDLILRSIVGDDAITAIASARRKRESQLPLVEAVRQAVKDPSLALSLNGAGFSLVQR